MEHETYYCGARLREVLTSYANGQPVEDVAAWIGWYLEHHCALCGVCDDVESLPPEHDGLCIYCWEDAHEQQRAAGVTPTA
jgi:hypothetical protein